MAHVQHNRPHYRYRRRYHFCDRYHYHFIIIFGHSYDRS